MADPSPSVHLGTTLLAIGNNTGIEVSPELVEQLGGGKRPQVTVDLNGYGFQTAIGVMSGQQPVPVNASIRKATGLAGGDPITVTLTADAAPRTVVVPTDFAVAMDAAPGTQAFFDGLATSIQRFHIDNVNGTKNPETRARRVEKAVGLFLAGKKR